MLNKFAIGGLLLAASLACNAKDIVIKWSADGGMSFIGNGNYSVEQVRTILHPGKSDGFWLKVHDVPGDGLAGDILLFVPPKSSADNEFLIHCNADLPEGLQVTFEKSGYKRKTLNLEGKYKVYKIKLERE